MDLAEATRDVDEYVAETLGDYQVRPVAEPKVIRDAVYGFQRFHPHELAIIDSPILQRLRKLGSLFWANASQRSPIGSEQSETVTSCSEHCY